MATDTDPALRALNAALIERYNRSRKRLELRPHPDPVEQRKQLALIDRQIAALRGDQE